MNLYRITLYTCTNLVQFANRVGLSNHQIPGHRAHWPHDDAHTSHQPRERTPFLLHLFGTLVHKMRLLTITTEKNVYFLSNRLPE